MNKIQKLEEEVAKLREEIITLQRQMLELSLRQLIQIQPISVPNVPNTIPAPLPWNPIPTYPYIGDFPYNPTYPTITYDTQKTAVAQSQNI